MSPHSLPLSRPEAALQQLLAAAYGVHSHSSCLPQAASANDVPQRAQVTERQRPRDCHIHVQQGWWTSTLSVSRPRTGHLGCDTSLTDHQEIMELPSRQH